MYSPLLRKTSRENRKRKKEKVKKELELSGGPTCQWSVARPAHIVHIVLHKVCAVGSSGGKYFLTRSPRLTPCLLRGSTSDGHLEYARLLGEAKDVG